MLPPGKAIEADIPRNENRIRRAIKIPHEYRNRMSYIKTAKVNTITADKDA